MYLPKAKEATPMPGYDYPDDGKLHVRYSELKRCSLKGVEKVVAERMGLWTPSQTSHMSFGQVRHTMWEEESKRTGFVPECFNTKMPVEYVEHEFATEVMPGVVLHSRPDAVSQSWKTVVDYKAIIGSPAQFRKSQQLILYAWQLTHHGIQIDYLCYLIEVWSALRDEVLMYESVEHHITLRDLSDVGRWLLKRVRILQAALEEAEKNT